MILLLLPTMTMLALELVRASIFVTANKLPRPPVVALILWVQVKLWLSSEVLPVMSIHTCISYMLALIVRAPHRLEMEHIEIKVFIKLINELHWYFWLWMSEWTIVSIFTLTRTIYVWWTELSFIFVWMVKLFYSVMSLLARISTMAFFTFLCKLTHFRLVSS
jgi:hypothetical protein